jgi:hypothetical protein
MTSLALFPLGVLLVAVTALALVVFWPTEKAGKHSVWGASEEIEARAGFRLGRVEKAPALCGSCSEAGRRKPHRCEGVLCICECRKESE